MRKRGIVLKRSRITGKTNLYSLPPEKLLLNFAAHQAVAILFLPWGEGGGVLSHAAGNGSPIALVLQLNLQHFCTFRSDSWRQGCWGSPEGKQSSPEHCSETLWGLSVYLGDCLDSQKICASQLSSALGLQPWPELEACVPGLWGQPWLPQAVQEGACTGSCT